MAEVVETLQVQKDLFIAATPDIVFESILEEMGPAAAHGNGKPMPMKVEPWPGGRWYRDLGDGAGHLWGHIQVIKPPTLIEICGPLFMSYAAINHVQYRLAAEGEGTRLKLTHRGIGQFAPDHMKGVTSGWQEVVGSIRTIAERRASR